MKRAPCGQNKIGENELLNTHESMGTRPKTSANVGNLRSHEPGEAGKSSVAKQCG